MSIEQFVNDIDSLFSDPVSKKNLGRWQINAKTLSFKSTQMTSTDRFIPNRGHMSIENLSLKSQNEKKLISLGKTIFQGDHLDSKILSFKKKPPRIFAQRDKNLIRKSYTQNQIICADRRRHRYVSLSPERVLDAPDLLDDFYLNLVDWSCNDILAIALGKSIYLWDACTGTPGLLHEGSHVVSSVSWMGSGTHIAVGMSNSDIQLWDVEKMCSVRSMKGHLSRVGALSWNNHLLSSGSRDAMIYHHDVRARVHHVWSSKGHEEEICGLKWSYDGTQLASGANDNKCCVWNVNSSVAKYSFTDSIAAVKAVAWCPWDRNILATGGGTADKHIRIYNTNTGELMKSVNTGSQVCSLIWAQHEKEILSSHGFSQNQLTLWKYPSMIKAMDFVGHSSRVLHTACSPDGSTVCSAAADETLRFWKIWKPPISKKKISYFKNNTFSARSIR